MLPASSPSHLIRLRTLFPEMVFPFYITTSSVIFEKHKTKLEKQSLMASLLLIRLLHLLLPAVISSNRIIGLFGSLPNQNNSTCMILRKCSAHLVDSHPTAISSTGSGSTRSRHKKINARKHAASAMDPLVAAQLEFTVTHTQQRRI